MTLSSGAFWWRLAQESHCIENHECFYFAWWPIKKAILALGRLKCLSVIEIDIDLRSVGFGVWQA
jgi:hypothetical protein